MTQSEAEELLAKAKLLHVVLAPVGVAFSNLYESFVQCGDVQCSVGEVLSMEALPEQSIVVITDIERLDRRAADGPTLEGPLRARAHRMMEDGCSIILLSKYPRIRYPDVAGSSLLDDARDYHPKNRAVEPSDHGLCALPAWVTDLNELDFMTQLVSELGTPLVARLDQILFESLLQPNDAISNLSAPERDALWFAGLLKPCGDSFTWSIPAALGVLKEGIANCLAMALEPPNDLAHGYECLWRIERRIRACLRAKAVALWGAQWKESLLDPGQRSRVVELAGEVAYPGVNKLNIIRDPLEWLTLGELLSLREDKQKIGDLGLPTIYWRRLKDEVVPIRNQISHMRITRPGDLTRLREWDLLLTCQLKPVQ